MPPPDEIACWLQEWTPIWEENHDASHSATSFHGRRYQEYSIALIRAANSAIHNLTELARLVQVEHEVAAL